MLRRARADDAEALASLGRKTFLETFVDEFQLSYPPDDLRNHLDTTYAVEATRDRLRGADEAWWVADDGGELVAYATAGPMSLPHPDGRPTHSELRRLYVLKRAQGAGLGRRLLHEALAWMEAHTDGPLWLGVWSGNVKAQRLYTAHGFEKAGEYKYRVGTWFDDEFIFRRPR